jgi:hypothetical protein
MFEFEDIEKLSTRIFKKVGGKVDIIALDGKHIKLDKQDVYGLVISATPIAKMKWQAGYKSITNGEYIIIKNSDNLHDALAELVDWYDRNVKDNLIK